MEKTLLIMAAGLGSRFGGLKQVEPMGPNGEYISDYAIYDAIRCGFTKVVFVIKKENLELFRTTIGKRVETKIKTEYVFQEKNDVPLGNVPVERVKPLGTAQAIYAARDVIHEPFLVINADDFYGYEAFKDAAYYIDNGCDYGFVAFQAKNVLTENGSVKRGVASVSDGYLKGIIESSLIKENNIIKATPLDNSPSFNISDDTPISMNMFIFNPSIFNYIYTDFVNFMQKNDLLNDEFLIPDVVFRAIKDNKIKVKEIKTSSIWLGVTYKEDKPKVQEGINKLIASGIYPINLFIN